MRENYPSEREALKNFFLFPKRLFRPLLPLQCYIVGIKGLTSNIVPLQPVTPLHFTRNSDTNMDSRTSDDPFAELYNFTDDPFASLYQQEPEERPFLVYVSSQLEWIMVREGACGEWVSANERWYKKFDANAYLWFFGQIAKALREMSASADECGNAFLSLEKLKELGLNHNAFTENELKGDLPRWYSFNANCPKWADLL